MPDDHEILLPLAPSAGDEPMTHLAVRVYYNKGGPDYFNGGTTARGYYVSASPVRIADGTCMSILGRGYKALVEETARLSAKRLASIAAEAHRQARERTGKAWELAVAALREGKLTLADPLTETAHAAVADAGGPA